MGVTYKTMKIIFLDIDWVIIPFWWPKIKGWLKDLHHKVIIEGEEFLLPKTNPKCIENLWYILEETGARIVLSSSWRRMPRLMKKLLESEENDWKDLWQFVNGSTWTDMWWRWNEILSYIQEYHKTCKAGWHITEWIAIDDDDAGMSRIRDLNRFIHTKSNVGLDTDSTRLAIEILNS